MENDEDRVPSHPDTHAVVILGLDPRIHAVTSVEKRGQPEPGPPRRVDVTAWVPGSPRRSFAPAPPWD